MVVVMVVIMAVAMRREMVAVMMPVVVMAIVMPVMRKAVAEKMAAVHSVAAAKAMRDGIDLSEEKAEADRGRSGDGFSQTHTYPQVTNRRRALSAFPRGISTHPSGKQSA